MFVPMSVPLTVVDAGIKCACTCIPSSGGPHCLELPSRCPRSGHGYGPGVGMVVKRIKKNTRCGSLRCGGGSGGGDGGSGGGGRVVVWRCWVRVSLKCEKRQCVGIVGGSGGQNDGRLLLVGAIVATATHLYSYGPI